MADWAGRSFYDRARAQPYLAQLVSDAAGSVAGHVFGVGAVGAITHPGVEVLNLGWRLLALDQTVIAERIVQLHEVGRVQVDVMLAGR